MNLHAGGDSTCYQSLMSKCFSFCSKPLVATINTLPDELLLYIFRHLDIDSVLQCEKVSRRWRNLATDSGLWRHTQIVCSAQSGQVCPKTVRLIKSHCKIVRNLRMQYILKYPYLSSLTTLCDNLLSLEMVMCRIQVEVEEDLKQWPHLKRLNFKNSMLKSERPLLLPLEYFKELTFLGLSDFGLTNENCDSLLQCQYLNHIVIEKIKGLSLSYMKTLISTKRDTLMTLHIYGGDSIDDDVMFLLAKCTVLKDLSIIRCESLTDRALDGVAKLVPITHLQIWNNYVFTEDRLKKTLEHVNLRKLQRLSLSKISNVTGAVVDIISEYYTNLTFLALYQCPKVVNNDYEKQLKAKFSNIEIVL